MRDPGASLLLLGARLLFFPGGIQASEPAAETEDEAGTRERAGRHRVEHHNHHIAVFVGTTRAEGENEPTIGLDYQYRLSSRLSIGGLVDHAGGDLDSNAVAAALFIHPVGGLEIVLGVGYENEDHERDFLVRAGVGYAFHVGKISLTPIFNVDFVDQEEIKVYGVNIGWGF
jgi:hypothetical protein